MGGGLSVENKSQGPILVQMSQLTPLYWGKTNKDATFHRSCGKVWFTVSAEPWWNESQEPTVGRIIIEVTLITVTAVVAAIGVATLVDGVTAGLAEVGVELAEADISELTEDAALLDGGGEAAETRFMDKISSIWNSLSAVQKAGVLAKASSPLLWIATMAMTGTRAIKPCSKAGVYANGETLTVKSRKNGDNLELYFA